MFKMFKYKCVHPLGKKILLGIFPIVWENGALKSPFFPLRKSICPSSPSWWSPAACIFTILSFSSSMEKTQSFNFLKNMYL